VLLTKELREKGYSTTLATGVCEDTEGDMRYLLESTDSVVLIHEMSRSVSPFKNLRALFHIWRLIRLERPDIVHTHTAMAGFVGRTAAILAGVPVLIHTFHGNSLRHYFSPFMTRVFITIERLLALRTDAICVIASQQLTELSGDFRIAHRSKFRLVPLGLDLSSYLNIPEPRPNHPIQIGWFGRLVDIKNIGLLLETALAVKNNNWRFEFHVAGDGPDSCLVKNYLTQLEPHLVWHGWLSDIIPLLSTCDLVIQTSRNEGTPVALIQGMAAGRPFVSTAVGGIVDMTCGEPQELTPGARWFDNAVLVDSRPEAFAAVLDRLASNPQQIITMGQSAREFAKSHYRKEALVAKLDSLYRELLEQKLSRTANEIS